MQQQYFAQKILLYLFIPLLLMKIACLTRALNRRELGNIIKSKKNNKDLVKNGRD
jgi:hypothetical protein